MFAYKYEFNFLPKNEFLIEFNIKIKTTSTQSFELQLSVRICKLIPDNIFSFERMNLILKFFLPAVRTMSIVRFTCVILMFFVTIINYIASFNPFGQEPYGCILVCHTNSV